MNKTLMQKPVYRITSIVLSKEEPFTFTQIFSELKQQGIQESECAVKMTLRRLRDRGIIVEQGSYYSLAV